MKKWKEAWLSLSETVTVTKLDGLLTVAVAALAGIIVGMLCSPRKNVKFGCNNGNHTENHFCEDEDFWDEDFTEEDEDEDEDCLSFK